MGVNLGQPRLLVASWCVAAGTWPTEMAAQVESHPREVGRASHGDIYDLGLGGRESPEGQAEPRRAGKALQKELHFRMNLEVDESP